MRAFACAKVALLHRFVEALDGEDEDLVTDSASRYPSSTLQVLSYHPKLLWVGDVRSPHHAIPSDVSSGPPVGFHSRCLEDAAHLLPKSPDTFFAHGTPFPSRTRYTFRAALLPMRGLGIKPLEESSKDVGEAPAP